MCFNISLRRFYAISAIFILTLLAAKPVLSLPLKQTDNPNPPEQTVKLIFIHHSTGENWLRDDYGYL
ncbi:MAG: hypothetical protein ACU837_15300, partial [Gammaproteobacteria bacterium]